LEKKEKEKVKALVALDEENKKSHKLTPFTTPLE